MHAQQEFGTKDVFSHVIGDMAKAISERRGEGKQEQFVRAGVAAAMIVDLEPQTIIEVMLSGHCVMFHEVMTDSIRDTLRGELDAHRHGTRSNIVAMNKAFHINLDRLDRSQNRQAIGRGGAPEIPETPEEMPRDNTSAHAPSQVAPPDAESPTPQDTQPDAAKAQIPPAVQSPDVAPPNAAIEVHNPGLATPRTVGQMGDNAPVQAASDQIATQRPSGSVSSPT